MKLIKLEDQPVEIQKIEKDLNLDKELKDSNKK